MGISFPSEIASEKGGKDWKSSTISMNEFQPRKCMYVCSNNLLEALGVVQNY